MSDSRQVTLLKELRKRANSYKYIHWSAFGYKQKMYYCLNLPVVILSAFTTAMTFYDINSSSGSDLALQIALGVIEVAVLGMSAASTFLKCGQRSSGHQHTYRGYEELILRIDKLLADSAIIDEEEIGMKYEELFDKYSNLLSNGEQLTVNDALRLNQTCTQQNVTSKDMITVDICV